MFNQCKPAEAIERYAGDSYIQPIRTSETASRLSSTTSSEWPLSTPASEWSSFGRSPTGDLCTGDRCTGLGPERQMDAFAEGFPFLPDGG